MTGFLDLWTSMILNDLEPLKKEILVNFFSQFLDAAHISTLNCDEMAGDRPRRPAYEIFSIKRRFQQSKSRPSRFKEAGAGRYQRQLPPPKSGYFTAIFLCSMKTVADRYRHAAYHNKRWWQAFLDLSTLMTLNDPEPPKKVCSEFFAIFGCSAHFNTELQRNG